MNRRTLVLATAGVAGLLFLAGWFAVDSRAPSAVAPDDVVNGAAGSALVRPHSPVLGPADAPVTVVEFFDPACEACRAFHPIIDELRTRYPDRVRVVMRYATFHEGSDVAVQMLEAARRQDLFEPVLEALYAAQPEWARHGNPDLDVAWRAAEAAGLDVERARANMALPAIDAVIRQDAADIETVGVRQTPTFFVNGRPLLDFGPEQLIAMVRLQAEPSS